MDSIDAAGVQRMRDLDRFVLSSSRYTWVDMFQRTDIRRTTAYARYYLDNIATWSQRAAEAGVLGVVTSAWYDFPVEALIPGIVCTGQTAWNPSGVSAAVR